MKKWQTLIEAHVDAKTTDGYVLRLFCVAFTKKRQNQLKKTTYAQTSQIREIRKKMTEIMTKEVVNSELKDVVLKFVPESIGKAIEKAASAIFPVHSVAIRKVKIMKSPKFDGTRFFLFARVIYLLYIVTAVSKLLELHSDSASTGVEEIVGAPVARDFKEPVPSDSV